MIIILGAMMTAQNKSNTFKVLGVLLQYPSESLVAALGECTNILSSEALLSKKVTHEIEVLIQHLLQSELLALEESYVSLFDFKRSLSLHLLEHTYGDSRDRGQALLDMASCYEKSGLQLQPGSMPDFLPIFLEHLSLIPHKKASEVLSCHVNTIALLEQRLIEHDSAYAAIFTAVKSLSASKEDQTYVQKAMKNYSQDKDDNKKLDEQWREPEVFSNPNAKNKDYLHHDALQKNNPNGRY